MAAEIQPGPAPKPEGGANATFFRQRIRRDSGESTLRAAREGSVRVDQERCGLPLKALGVDPEWGCPCAKIR